MKVPHIVCHELFLISFPLLAVAEVVCLATLIPIGQRALQREEKGEQMGEEGRCASGTQRREGGERETSEEKGVREEGDNEVRGTA